MAIVVKNNFATIKIDLNFQKQVNAIFYKKTTQGKLGEILKEEITWSTKKGISPLKSYGRFERYRADRPDRPKDTNNKSYYPNNVKHKYPDKRKRPVNLTLSGEYLRKLEYRASPTGLKFGWFSLSGDMKEKYETNNLGLNPFVPQRKILPTSQAESFKTSIVRRLKNTLNDIIIQELKKR